MPRVENQGDNVTEWCEREDEGSSTYDVCTRCHARLEADPFRFDDKLQPYGPKEPDGDEGWGGDVSHPPYDDEEYDCAVCGKRLTGKDD